MSGTQTSVKPVTVTAANASSFRYFRVRDGSYLHTPRLDGVPQLLARPGDVLDLSHPLLFAWMGDPESQWFKLEGLKDLPKGATVAEIRNERVRRMINVYDAQHGKPDLDPESGRGGRSRDLDPSSVPAITDPRVTELSASNARLETENASQKQTIGDLQKRIEALEAAQPQEGSEAPKASPKAQGKK